jgi:hypothetical protein
MHRIDLHGVQSFDKRIWKVIAHSERPIIFLELRSEADKQVVFACWDLNSNKLLFDDLAFAEPWWISLADSSGDILLFTLYTDPSNPEKKAALAFDFVHQKETWWRNNFSITAINAKQVIGTDSKFDQKEIILDLFSGEPAANRTGGHQNFSVIKPLQYNDKDKHFATVGTFVNNRTSVRCVDVIEYLEYEDLIIISCFSRAEGLANFLFVFDYNGELLISETLGTNLKGIATDTFFVLSGYVIFVKNGHEVVSYKI